jgi:hypothetical protein
MEKFLLFHYMTSISAVPCVGAPTNTHTKSSMGKLWKSFHAKALLLFHPPAFAVVCVWIFFRKRENFPPQPTPAQRHDINFVIKNPSPSKYKSRMKIMK